jgi:gliding motility-associated-like protein
MNNISPHFLWSGGIAGLNDSIATNLCAGNYSVTIADTNGCFAVEPFNILEPPQLIIDQIVSIDETCPGDCDGSITVQDPLGFLYSFDGGVNFGTSNTLTGLCPGAFDIVMLDSNGCATASNALIASPPPVLAQFIYSPDSIYTDDTFVEFFNTSQNAVTFQWDIVGLSSNTDYHTSYTFPDGLGSTYEVCLVASDANGCSDEYCQMIEILDVLQVWVPNAFTPDGNGINESFGPVFNGSWIRDYEFLIFNRWGELIFESERPGHGWDGNYKGSLVQDGVYAWKLIYKDQRTNKVAEIFGHVTVLR